MSQDSSSDERRNEEADTNDIPDGSTGGSQHVAVAPADHDKALEYLAMLGADDETARRALEATASHQAADAVRSGL